MSESSPKARCVPLTDEQDPPTWVRDALTGNQSKLRPRSKWVLSLDHVELTPAERLVLYRLWIYTMGKDDHHGQTFTCYPSVPTLARQLTLSPSAVRAAIRRCETLGFLHTDRDDKDGKSNTYTLAWPRKTPAVKADRIARFESWCKGKTNAGKLCRRPAGWGTDHVGQGPCKFHDPRQKQSGGTTEGVGGTTTDSDALPRQKQSPSSLGSPLDESATESDSVVVPFQRESA